MSFFSQLFPLRLALRGWFRWTMHEEKVRKSDWCYLSQLMPDAQQFSDLTGTGPLDLDCVPTIPQTTKCQVYLQTILLHLAALFGELFPQKCKHHYPRPSMGKSDRVCCIQDTKMQCARLKTQTTGWIKEICALWGSEIRWDVRQTCQWRVFKTLLIMSSQFTGCRIVSFVSFLFFFLGVAFFPSFFPPSLLPLCIRARVSNSFIILDGSSGSLRVPFLFHLMPVLINVGSCPCTQKLRY